MLITYNVTINTDTGEATIVPVLSEKDPLGLFGAKREKAAAPRDEAEITKRRAVGAEFLTLWNRICVPAGLRKVVALSDKRAVHCYERATEMTKALGQPADVVFKAVCEKVAASKFLRGEAEPNPKSGHAFVCTFDWLIQYVGNWLKVYEGNYDDGKEINSLNVNDLWQ